MDRFLLAIVFFASLFLTTTKAYSATYCACEIGQDKGQKGIFKIGCDIWLSQQSQCNTRKIVDRKTGLPLASYLPKLQQGDQVKIGYVGHWDNFYRTVEYVDEQIVPLAKTKGVHVVYDNTGCSPMDNPENVQEYLKDLNLPKKSQITVKGSQMTSVGMWDGILWNGHANLYAYANTEWHGPRFLACDVVEGKLCSRAHQAGERGRCLDTNIKKQAWLYCLKPKWGSGEYEWSRN